MKQQPVVFAYLFGSQATGRARHDSDVDVAVYLDESVPPDRHLDLSIGLAGALQRTSGLGPIEALDVLNEAPLRLRGRVPREGRPIFSR